MKKLSLRQQTEGAMLAVVAAIIALATYIPLVGTFLFLAAPVPIVLATLRHGVKLGLITALLCTFLLFVFMGPAQAVLFFVASGSQGALIGTLVRYRLSPLRLMILGMACTVALTAVSIHMGAFLMGFEEPFEDLRKSMSLALEQTESLFSAVDSIPEEQRKMQQKLFSQQKKTMKALLDLPLLFFFIAGFGFIVNYQVCKWICQHMDENLPPLPPFRTWRLPPWSALLLLFLPAMMPRVESFGELLKYPLHFNLLMFCRLLFFFVGLAAASYYFHKKEFPMGLRIPAYLLLAVPLQQITFFIGIADTVAAWREPDGSEGADDSEGPDGSEGADGSEGPDGSEGADDSEGPDGSEGADGSEGSSRDAET